MEEKKPSEIVPSPYGQLFSIYDKFNAMQMALLNDLLYTDKSIVLSAPTGSGKTVAFELAIVRMLLEADCAPSTSTNPQLSPRAIYIAPIKALCGEKFDSWKSRFETVGITCTQLTGDTQSANLTAMQQAQVVISTPEKWDSITRRLRDNKQWIASIRLFIVDEVHLLDEDTRGPILEAIVARMKSSGVKRFLVASATIPNAEDLTSWLSSYNANVAQYVFSETQRPVPLKKHVIGVNTKLEGFKFDMMLNYKLPDIIQKYAEGKATLIFCSSRKSAEMAAFNLIKTNSIFQLTNQQKSYLNQLAQQLIDTKLRKIVENGIAYHHAGLQYADRSRIETSFREGFLMVLLSTSTLAMGINLPAHLVVIKSTETYTNGGYAEYPEHVLLQMIGRAGRPQYDTKGVAVILTQSDKIAQYKKLISGKSPIESHLHKHLTEHLNSEIALSSITSLQVAMNWIRSTYLYIRSVRNPIHYGFPENMSKDHVEHKLEELSLKQIMALEQAGLVKINHTDNLHLRTTALGKLMAKYYMSFETMKLLCDLKGNETLENIFNLITQSKEMTEFTLRVNEKTILNKLNKTPIRFPIKERIKKSEEKISCIIQAVLENLEITMPALVQESHKMFRIGERVSQCLLEYVRRCVQKCLCNKTAQNRWYQALLNALTVAKCFHVKLWENSQYASKQLHGIGTVYSTLLLNAGKSTLQSIAKTDARTIEHILNKPAPFGDEVLQNLNTFPEYEIKLTRKSNDFVDVYAKQVNENYIYKGGASTVLIIGDSFNNLLLLTENFDSISMEYGKYERTIRLQDPHNVEYIYGHVIHISLVGVDVHQTLEINAPKFEESRNVIKKAGRQTRLNITLDENTNISDFILEKTVKDENNIFDETHATKTLDESRFEKFHFSKPKIYHGELGEKSKIEKLIGKAENSQKIVTIKPLNELLCMNSTKALNITNADRTLKQRKLTEFFEVRKEPILKTVNLRKFDCIKKTQKEKNHVKVTQLSSDFAPTANIQVTSNSREFDKKSMLKTVNLQKFDCIKKTQKEKIQVKVTQLPDDFAPTANIQVRSNSREIDITTMLQALKACEKSGTEQINSFENTKGITKTLPAKRKISKNNNSSNVNPLEPPAKKAMHQKTSNLNTAYKSCPISLSSFLGNIGQMKSMNSMLDTKNLPKENKNQQKILPPKTTIKTNAENSNQKINNNFSRSSAKPAHKEAPLQNILEFTTPISIKTNSIENVTQDGPLDMSKKSIEKMVTDNTASVIYIPNTNKHDAAYERNVTEKEFALWYKVAMQFQKIPMQAMSLQNFRYVYNKVISKEIQAQQNQLHVSINTISSSPTENDYQNCPLESSHSSSSIDSHLSQILPNNEHTSNTKFAREQIKLINQNVMRQVLDRKSMLNSDEIVNFDEELAYVLEDLQKQFSIKNST